MKKVFFLFCFTVLYFNSVNAQLKDETYAVNKDTSFTNLNYTRFINMIGGHVLLNFLGQGLSLNYTGFYYRPKKKVFIGGYIGVEHHLLSMNPEIHSENRLFRTGQIGAQIMPRLSRQYFVKLGFNFLVGETKQHSRLGEIVLSDYGLPGSEIVYGTGLSQGITFIPINKKGFSLGVLIYQRLYIFEQTLFDIGAQLSFAVVF
jgi:hypothetical protein